MALFEKFVNKKEFSSYEEFKRDLRIIVPRKFQFCL